MTTTSHRGQVVSAAARFSDHLAITACDGVLEPAHYDALRAAIPGWSDQRHWVFWRGVAQWFSTRPPAAILILGVYHGLDITMLRAHGCTAHIVGVDKFDPLPCADWPAEARGQSWEAAGMGLSPSLAGARAQLEAHGAGQHTTLIASDDAAFLATCPLKFDLIYLDTAHDAETVTRQIEQIRARHLLTAGGILAGDDYPPLKATWGVDAAVRAAFPGHYVFAGHIWFADGVNK